MRTRRLAAGQRAAMAMLMALAFALRLLTPDGFMPAFAHGAVTIVACPDASAMAPMAGHHHHDGKIRPQPCPYAAAAGHAGTLPGGAPGVAALAPAGVALLPGLRAERRAPARTRDRPPATGPPLLPA